MTFALRNLPEICGFITFLVKTDNKRGLRINEDKTKYKEVTRAVSDSDRLRCGKYEFGHVN